MPANESCDPSFSGDAELDGKMLFGIMRERLDDRAFGAFMECMKQYRKKELAPQDMLKKVKAIVGQENEDLFLNFQALVLPEDADDA